MEYIYCTLKYENVNNGISKNVEGVYSTSTYYCAAILGTLMLSSIQVQQLSASNSAEMKGTMESLVMIVRKQGYKQLFSGLSINYLKVRGMPLIWMLIFLLSLANS